QTTTPFPYTTLFRSIQLRMKIPFTFPEAIPQLYLKDIPDGFSHINPDNSCCVSSYGEIFVFLATKPGIKEFIRAFIDPFIFSLRSEEHTSELQSRFD